MPPLLDVQNVSKVYRTSGEQVSALENVSFQLRAGELVALTGRSGGGKSTFLNMCGAMDFPSDGQVLIDGQNTSALSDSALTRLRREKIGFIFQSFQLIHTLTAVENVELPLLLARRPAARKLALERLEWVGLGSLASRYTHQLSGGQQQRIAIARALVGNPKLVLADEPTGNLDTTTGEAILHLLSRVAGELNAGVIMATHSVESAALAHRVVKLRDGKLQEDAVHA